jgi:hypothetical protein
MTETRQPRQRSAFVSHLQAAVIPEDVSAQAIKVGEHRSVMDSHSTEILADLRKRIARNFDLYEPSL